MLTDRDYELLSNYLDDALNYAERVDLETRLNDEAELRRELEALRSTVALINALPPRKTPRNFTLDANMARRPAAPRRRFLSPMLVSTLSAVAAVVLIGFGLLSLTSNQNAAPQSANFGFSAIQQEQGQQSIAQVPTASPMLKTDEGATEIDTTGGETATEPLALSDAPVLDTETPTIDLLNQASGGGVTEGTFSRDQQDGQQTQEIPPAIGSAADSNAAPADDTVIAPFFAPSAPLGTIEGYTTQFPGAETSTLQNNNAQTGASNIASQSSPAVAPTYILPSQNTVGITAEEISPVQLLTATPAPSITPTDTPVPSETPTDTPVPSTPSPAPPPVPVSAPASTGDTLPLASLVVGVILLVVALVFYLRSRRNA